MFWKDKSVVSSMEKLPVEHPLDVKLDQIVGDSFKNADLHGTVDSVIYIMGLDALNEYSSLLGKPVKPGAAGENITVESLHESNVFVGDVFEIGEVQLVATAPRIPCGKVNYRFQHENAQQIMKDLGRSGFYGKILKPGLIKNGDFLKKISECSQKVSIQEIYTSVVENRLPNSGLYQRLKDNPHFPKNYLPKFLE